MDAIRRKADDVAPEETKVDTEASQGSNREELNKKLRQTFDGKIVRKDLTKHIKEGASVPSSTGMEPNELSYREKWLLLTRMLPLVENNFNLCKLGPRSTGKSHLYKEISLNSILVSDGQTTVANLFYNMGRKTMGLVGLWDVVAFDEVAGINFKDKDGIQIMKDYMASGSFARDKEEKGGLYIWYLKEISIKA